jgi:hypothetical protein
MQQLFEAGQRYMLGILLGLAKLISEDIDTILHVQTRISHMPMI